MSYTITHKLLLWVTNQLYFCARDGGGKKASDAATRVETDENEVHQSANALSLFRRKTRTVKPRTPFESVARRTVAWRRQV